MQFVKIGDKEYPVIYSMPAMMWFCDFVGITMAELEDQWQDMDSMGRKVFALLYSGLVTGSEARNKRLDISFPEFQELVLFDEELQETLGTLFRRQMELTLKKLQDQASNKKKLKESTSEISTSD